MFKKTISAALSLVLAVSAFSVAAVRVKAEDRVQEIVSGMSLRQKVAQMIIPSARTWTEGEETNGVTELNDSIKTAVAQNEFGGLILFAENTRGTAQTARLSADLQNAAIQGKEEKIPMLLAIDQEGGYIVRLNTGSHNPGNMALGATNDTRYATKSAEIIASELDALGINVDFAPDADTNNNPNNPIIGIRSFSDDPQMVAEFVPAFIEGMHNYNIVTSLKHFPGHGDTATDSHTGLPKIDKSYDEIKNFELVPFQSAINSGADMIMTAHIQYPAIEKETYVSKLTGEEVTLPATLSKTIITDVLREDMGFDGVVVTDAMNMDAIAKHFDRYDAAKMAINAGVDMLLMPVALSSEENIRDSVEYLDTLVKMVQDGDIDQTKVDQACQRILKLKLDRGILDKTTFDRDAMAENALKIVGSKEHHDQELAIAEKAVTLIRNENQQLPFQPEESSSIVFLSEYNSGVNSMTYAADQLKAKGVIPENTSVEVFAYDGLTFGEMQETLSKADYIVVNTATYDHEDFLMEYDYVTQAMFIEPLLRFAKTNGKKLVLISSQLPYDLARYTDAEAVLVCYNAKGMPAIPTEFNGETTGYGPNLIAAINTVFGDNNPTGKLPVNIYALDEDYYFTSDIVYAKGFGLTYAGETSDPEDNTPSEASVPGEESTKTESEVSTQGEISGSESKEPESSQKDSIPANTGDHSAMVICLAVLLLSAAGGITVVILRKNGTR